MLLLALAGGLRVSELVGVCLDELQFNDRYVDVRVRGKGRRERALTLWKSVGDAIRTWLAVRGEAPAPELFLNAWGKSMTRSGFQRVLAKHVAAAATRCPSLRQKRVSPHALRHTCALNTLQATRDLRKVSLWLGHASTQTTDVYLQADPTEKLEALAVMKAPALRPGKFRPPDRLIAALRASTVMRSSGAVNPWTRLRNGPGGPHNSPLRMMPLSAAPAGRAGAPPASGRRPRSAHAQDRMGGRHPPLRTAGASREAGRPDAVPWDQSRALPRGAGRPCPLARSCSGLRHVTCRDLAA
jgi:hypothetical protein